MPLPEASISHGLTPRPVLTLPQASGHKLQGLEPSKTEKLTGVLPYSPRSPHETSTTTTAESHGYPLPPMPQTQAQMTHSGPARQPEMPSHR